MCKRNYCLDVIIKCRSFVRVEKFKSVMIGNCFTSGISHTIKADIRKLKKPTLRFNLKNTILMYLRARTIFPISF